MDVDMEEQGAEFGFQVQDGTIHNDENSEITGVDFGEPSHSSSSLNDETYGDTFPEWSMKLDDSESMNESGTMPLYPEQLCSIGTTEDSSLHSNGVERVEIKVEPPDYDMMDEDSEAGEPNSNLRILDNRELKIHVETLSPELVKRHMEKLKTLKTRMKQLRAPRRKKIKIEVESEYEEEDEENPFDLDTIYAKGKRNGRGRPKKKQPVKIRVQVMKPVQIPRKRGRKKKSSPIPTSVSEFTNRERANKTVVKYREDSEDDFEPLENEFQFQTNGDESDEPHSKRRRGRRKTIIESDFEDEALPKSKPKKRGRKKKKISADGEGDAEEGEDKPKKKRGRKKKVLTEDDAEAGEAAEGEDSELKPKKKRKPRQKKEKVDPNLPPPECGPCNMCMLKFHTDEQLTTHACVKFSQIENKRWQCGFCPHNSSKKDEMVSHIRRHTGEKPFKCKYNCGAAFKDKRNCRIHQMSRKHENDRKFSCPICNLKFTSSTLMRCHEATHGERKHFCSFAGCNRGFLTRIRLTYHERRHRGEKVICPVCGEGIFQADQSRHKKRCALRKQREEEETKAFKDVLEQPIINQNGIYTCKECRLQFDSEFNLVAHPCCRFQVLAENVWRCGICNKIKKMSLSDMKEHLKVHTAEKKYACPICGKKFRYESRKLLHVQSHTGLKNYLCQTCGASYTNKPRFVQHLRAKHPEIPPETVVPLKRTGEARQAEKQQHQEMQMPQEPVVRRARKARSPNRKSTNHTARQPEHVQHQPLPIPLPLQVQPGVSHAHENQMQPIPMTVPYTINQPQLQQLQGFTNYPPRQMLPDPREWNWQWQGQGQVPVPNLGYTPHPHQPYYQYHPQQTVNPVVQQSCEPSGPSSIVSAASVEGSEVSSLGNSQSDDFLGEADMESVAGADWQDDDFEDPWEAVFPSKPPAQNRGKPRRTVERPAVLNPTIPPPTDLSQINEAELITKVGPNSWKCNHCLRISKYLFEMRSHVRIHLGIKPFACPQCDKRFKDKRNMKIHYRIHSGEFPYTCPHPQCGKQFRHNAPFNVHKRSHGDLSFLIPSAADLPFQCTVCEQRYRTEEDRTTHACPNYAPIEGGSFRCGVCAKIFRRRREVSSHVLIHTGDNPYCCDVCGKGFKNKRSMIRHQDKTHLGITKQFTCSICSKIFTTNYNKDIHERKHKQELLEICNICAMGFFDKQSYKGHMARHEAGLKVPCTICNTELTTKYELCVHSKTHGIFPKTKPNRKRKPAAKKSEEATIPAHQSPVKGDKVKPKPKAPPSDSDSDSESEESESSSESEEEESPKVPVKRNPAPQRKPPPPPVQSESDDSDSEESESESESDTSEVEFKTKVPPKSRATRSARAT